MLYDNALLTRLYLEGFQATGDAAYARVARDTLAYVGREMTHPEGGFYAAQDADSEGVEGKFFVWTPDEVVAAVGPENADVVARFYDVTEAGNFEHKNILSRVITEEQLAKLFRRPPAEIAAILADARGKLLAGRGARIAPARDEKILTSWNALMIGAFAEAYKILGDAAYRDAAERAVAFVYSHLHRDGVLLRTWTAGEAKLDAYLDDYAFLLNALLDLYEGTADPSLVERARGLADTILTRFEDRERGGFYFTGTGHEELVHRPKPVFDGSIPSGNSAAVFGLLRLFHYVGEQRFLDSAERALRAFDAGMTANPFGFANMIAAADLYLRKPREIVVVAKPGEAATTDLLARLHCAYVANKTIVVSDPASPAALPAVEGKAPVAGAPTTVYVCHRYMCSPPVTTWKELAPLLGSRSAAGKDGTTPLEHGA
jgi:uncharacterized protein YyaL (SSP411 family)